MDMIAMGSDWRQVPRDQAEAAMLEQLTGTADGAITVPEGSTPEQRNDMLVNEMLERLAKVGRWRDAT